MNLKDALELPILKVGKLLTDAAVAEDREITWVSVIEVPVGEFIRSGEFVLSTGMNVGHDTNLLTRFVSEVADGNASALALAVGPHTPSVPSRVIRVANQIRLPLIELPWETRFSEISEEICKRLIRDQAAKRSRDDFVWSLVTGRVTEDDIAANRKYVKFDRDLTYAAIVGRVLSFPPQVDGSFQNAVRSIETACADAARQHQLEWLGTTVESAVVAYLQVPRTSQRIRSLLTAVQGRVKTKCKIAWGIGRACRDLPDFVSSYDDALVASEFGSRMNADSSITDVSDILADRLLLTIHRDANALLLLAKYIKPLREVSRTPLLPTLQVFFDNDCNVSEAARKLSISRQSLVSRLGKIENLLNVDLKAPEDRFALALSLRIHKLQNAMIPPNVS